MKHIVLGICTIMLVTAAIATDNSKPAKKAAVKTEKKAACKPASNCKDAKACVKATTPRC